MDIVGRHKWFLGVRLKTRLMVGLGCFLLFVFTVDFVQVRMDDYYFSFVLFSIDI